MPYLQKVLRRTDWTLLAKQKAALVETLAFQDPEDELFQGLLSFLDALMDGADKDGWPVVFLAKKEGRTQ